MTSMIYGLPSVEDQHHNITASAPIYAPENSFQQRSFRFGSESTYFSSDSECSMAQDSENFDIETFFGTTDDFAELNSAGYFPDLMHSQATNSSSSLYPGALGQSPVNYQNQFAFPDLNQCPQAAGFGNQCVVWNPESSYQMPQASDMDETLEISDIEVSDDDDDDVIQNRDRYCNPSLRDPKLPNVRTVFPEPQGNEYFNLPKLQLDYPTVSNYTTDTLRSRQRPGKQPILSQFLLHALETPKDYGNMIRWVDRQNGVFEFSSKNKENLARAWGLLKNNRRSMTYPKMARALRKYIENGIVLEKMKNRLRYKFLADFLDRVRSGREATQLSSAVKSQMYHFSRMNISR